MAKIIDGKALAEKINDKTVREVVKLDRRPNLAIILVGDNPDSSLYVGKKEKKAKEIGIDTHCYKCDEDIGQAKMLEMIDFFNKDDLIDAIMVQLPLPREQGYNTDEIIARIKPKKDVDRFHPSNIGPITTTCDFNMIMPPVFGVILEMLASIDCDLEGNKVTILANSEIFGGSLAKVLECRGAECSVVSADDTKAKEKCSQADILISVIGRPRFVKKDMVKKDAVIIDVGITREMGSIYGDVDFEDVKDKAGYISPVPGGVGPMTVAITLRNVLELYKRRSSDS